MNSRLLKGVEILVLFILFPISLALDYPILIKFFIGIFGYAYITWILLTVEKIRLKFRKPLPWTAFWKRTVIFFSVIVLLTITYVLLYDSSNLFFVPLKNPWLFVLFFIVYVLLSAWPQEILYRAFFFSRYGALFKNESTMIVVNSVLFSLAHLFFRNALVIAITFVGGILFGLTYLKFKSTTLVTIEHALYGNWLFAVGMGSMLGFPGFEN